MKTTFLLPAVFLVINILVFAGNKFLVSNDVDFAFILGANAILFVLSTFGYYVQKRGAKSANLNAFLRGIYSSLLLKMFLIVGAIIVYIVIIGGSINRTALLISMAIYLLYTMIEVTQLMKLVRKKPNG